jgi:uncharacterized protein (TIGR02145 family)
MVKLFFLLIWIGLTNSFAFAQSKIVPDEYIPEGEWIRKEVLDNSPGLIELYVPRIITNCQPDILKGNTIFHNNSLFYSRRKLYKELFMELMLQTTTNDLSFESEVIQAIGLAEKTENYGIKILGELKFISKSSKLYKELPYQLELVSLVFSVDSKVQKAEFEAAILYSCLSAFSEARYKLFQSALSRTKYLDPDMKNGLSDAYAEITYNRKKDLTILKKDIENSTMNEEFAKGLVKMATGGLFGNVISTIAGKGLVSVSLSAVLPTAWFWQLGRTFNSQTAEASIVLLSTIDKILLNDNLVESSYADTYILKEMRSHLSFMILQASHSDLKYNSCMAKNEKSMVGWISGWPYFNVDEMNILKLRAISELEISSPGNLAGNNSDYSNINGTFTDVRDGKIYKWVKIGDQIWMAENLSFKPYNGKYWIYNNDKNNISRYGYLYDLKTAINSCPEGWKIPNYNDWQTVEDYLKKNGDNDILPNCFSSYPGGALDCNKYIGEGNYGEFWSTGALDSPGAYAVWMVNSDGKYFSRQDGYDDNGYSIRCIRDIELQPMSESDIEKCILNIMTDSGEVDVDTRREDPLMFEFYDLNDDGKTEVIVWNLSIAGAQNCPVSIWEIDPIRKISLYDNWIDDINVLETQTNNYHDIIEHSYVSGEAYDTTLRNYTTIMHWDRLKKAYIIFDQGFKKQ